MVFFVGRDEFKVDAKGRVSVPARFRSEIEMQEAGSIYLAAIPGKPLLEGFTQSWLQALAQRRAEMSRPAQETFGVLVSQARPFKLDETGRLVLPKDMLAHAKISGMAVFIGRVETFRIYGQEEAQRIQGTASSTYQEGADEFSEFVGFDLTGDKI